MVCTRADINLTAGWTGAQLMVALEQAHIDAGLAVGSCTDRWTNGSYDHLVHRVQLTADPFGSDYVWWTFVSGVLYYSRAVNGWNSTTHVPLGTQYLDFGSTAGNSTSFLVSIGNLSTASSLIVRRYTSGTDSKFTAFVLKQGSTQICWFYTSTNATPQAWADLTKRSMHNVWFPNFYTTSFYTWGGFCQNYGLRRDIDIGYALKGLTSSTWLRYQYNCHFKYAAWGSRSGSSSNFWQDFPSNMGNAPSFNNQMTRSVITLPGHDPASNPAYASKFSPIYSGLAYNAYVLEGMPSDFGLASVDSNTMLNGDGLIVEAGVEEWEVVTHRNNSNSPPDVASMAFCARMV
jgi:hypothetical protein